MTKSCFFLVLGIVAALFLLCGCRSAASTADIPVVNGFDGMKYMATWYEIARMPTWFERDLDCVTAEYSRRDDGMIQVKNCGVRNGETVCATGVAKFKGSHEVGFLRVSFQRPFYGDYRIIYLTEDYSIAMVTGSTRDYLWILARKAVLPEDELRKLLEKAEKLGFDVKKMIFPKAADAVAE
jgi:apolipoprotein D and lipocalin family protein